MENNNLLSSHQWHPLAQYGFTQKFWSINIDTLISTSVVTTLIILFCLYAHFALQKNNNSVSKFIVLKYVDAFKDLLRQTLQCAPLGHLAFIGSLFTFIFCCNTIACIPLLEEPTKDINTTLALGLISVFYVQGYAIYEKGIKEYLYEFTQPFIFMLPLEVIGKLTPILSLSFRLFGNIFGGYVIMTLWHKAIATSIVFEIAGIVSGMNLGFFIFFGMFEGAIQAFVFSMLTLTYLSMATAHDEGAE